MIQEIDGIKFKLKEPYDFRFLVDYGKAFQVFDDQDSGNICFGTEKDGKKYFIKFAGAKAVQDDREKRQSSITDFINEWNHFTEQQKVG